MDFEKFLNETAEKLDREIRGILVDWLKEVSQISPKLVPLAQAFIKACGGGKRIRGSLVRLGYELAKQSSVVSRQSSDKEQKESLIANSEAILKAESSIIKVGAAYEILHTSILAHDDIIDKSPTRRGQPSLYKSVGMEQAITLADYGFFLSMKIISESKFDEKLKNQALRLFSQTMVDTAIGQMLDVAGGDPETVALLKTARYTISGPLILGAILGGLGPTSPRLRGVKLFGENLGIAFQIRDDILDGESVDGAEANALKYADKAKALIPKLTDDAKTRKLLQDLVDYMVERSS